MPKFLTKENQIDECYKNQFSEGSNVKKTRPVLFTTIIHPENTPLEKSIHKNPRAERAINRKNKSDEIKKLKAKKLGKEYKGSETLNEKELKLFTENKKAIKKEQRVKLATAAAKAETKKQLIQNTL